MLVAHLPMGSAVWAIQADIPYGWTLTDVLIADVFHALTGEPHPLRIKFGARAQQQRHAELFARLRAQREKAANNT